MSFTMFGKKKYHSQFFQSCCNKSHGHSSFLYTYNIYPTLWEAGNFYLCYKYLSKFRCRQNPFKKKKNLFSSCEQSPFFLSLDLWIIIEGYYKTKSNKCLWKISFVLYIRYQIRAISIWTFLKILMLGINLSTKFIFFKFGVKKTLPAKSVCFNSIQKYFMFYRISIKIWTCDWNFFVCLYYMYHIIYFL